MSQSIYVYISNNNYFNVYYENNIYCHLSKYSSSTLLSKDSTLEELLLSSTAVLKYSTLQQYFRYHLCIKNLEYPKVTNVFDYTIPI